MVDAHQRLLRCVSDSLGLCHLPPEAHLQDRGHKSQPRPSSPPASWTPSFKASHHLVDLFNMLSGCDLRHHASVQSMEGDLGGDHIGQDFPAVLHHSRRRLVAGAFNRQYIDIFLSVIQFFSFLLCLISLSSSNSSSAVHESSFAAFAFGKDLSYLVHKLLRPRQGRGCNGSATSVLDLLPLPVWPPHRMSCACIPWLLASLPSSPYMPSQINRSRPCVFRDHRHRPGIGAVRNL